jgi:anaerobic magnesium-protoporphyrin IX monomethyl ester cyclase
MNILCIIPPHIPSYFNAGHHLPLYYVATYLRKNIPDVKVTCIDAAALNYTWKEICDALVQPVDLIVLMNEFDGVDTFPRFMNYKKTFCPSAKVITFGRLSKQIPRFFLQFGIDAIHSKGDYETGIASYVNFLKNSQNGLSGVMLQNGEPANAGIYLESDDWVLPDVNEIPYASYNFMYRNDLNKFCGIPQRQELVVPLGRGCPFMCDFCDVWTMQGKVERRLSVDRTVNYIVDAFEKQPFEYVSFYCPTFTLHHKWVMDFCQQMSQKKERYPWKCITVLKCLNRELVQAMSASGCVRISLGIESFTRSVAMGLPKCKQDILGPFEEIVKICNEFNVELNCFIMLGMPGDTPDDVEFTLKTCLEHGARIRPTIYTPFPNLRDTMTLEQVAEFNRQYFPQDYLPREIAHQYYKLFYDFKGDHPTRVTRNIAKKSLVAL